ncbi:hypothetical protein [Mycolicibacterium tokaiense]|uniref:Dihydroorotase n=1 Tax=Mycolicibacterium tokaiense TaxID=39695 RepID=A0A378TMC0_9MYCO|nr:hypothetical protein [Mycolicibacterium tokaiense]BBY84728.1 hypothetical protein MTOK_05100 [Mycolicibacterium tokaiense]STZ60766.1 dihydroorotase [Mycolicibacterium tokaiense]
MSTRTVFFENVLHPLTGTRSSVPMAVPSPAMSTPAVIDGTDLWALPAIYDGDAHVPLLKQGLRHQEIHSPLRGGVSHVNTALQWQEVRHADVGEIARFCASTRLPRYIPVLSIEPEDTDDFAGWLAEHGELIRTTWAPVCKLYSPDPNFTANIEAIWRAGLKAVVYAWDDTALDWVVDLRGGPLHHRHARSKVSADLMRSTPGATTQTSPHYLLELAPERAERLHVLPPVPGGADRTSLLDVLDTHIDMIATDDNAPIHGATGPGLSSQRYLVSALLTLAQVEDIPLSSLWPKVTEAPATIFGTAAFVEPSTVIVDPAARTPVGLETGADMRNPYVGLELLGAVVAMVSGGHGVVL